MAYFVSTLGLGFWRGVVFVAAAVVVAALLLFFFFIY